MNCRSFLPLGLFFVGASIVGPVCLPFVWHKLTIDLGDSKVGDETGIMRTAASSSNLGNGYVALDNGTVSSSATKTNISEKRGSLGYLGYDPLAPVISDSVMDLGDGI